MLDVSTHVPKHLELLERAIGVIYRADTERFSHYFQARVSRPGGSIAHLCQSPNIVWSVGEVMNPFEGSPFDLPTALSARSLLAFNGKEAFVSCPPHIAVDYWQPFLRRQKANCFSVHDGPRE